LRGALDRVAVAYQFADVPMDPVDYPEFGISISALKHTGESTYALFNCTFTIARSGLRPDCASAARYGRSPTLGSRYVDWPGIEMPGQLQVSNLGPRHHEAAEPVTREQLRYFR
ncbi:MAG TPA: hypothetical protein VH083_08535, partial [Myxococcales bacterium]|nr:hypothetical protein [Myxococcales bacterium]